MQWSRVGRSKASRHRRTKLFACDEFTPLWCVHMLNTLLATAIVRIQRAAIPRMDLPSWPACFDNTLLRDLRPEAPELPPRQSRSPILGAHYTVVPPAPAPDPRLVAYSVEAARLLGLKEIDCESDEFLRIFSGCLPGGTAEAADAKADVSSQDRSAHVDEKAGRGADSSAARRGRLHRLSSRRSTYYAQEKG